LRHLLLRTAVLTGVAVVAITEALSPLHALSRWPVAIAWALLLALLVRTRPRLRLPSWKPIEGTLALATAAVAALIALTATLSPPNSADAMAYHLPRVVYWGQSGTVAFFPTPYLNQIMLQPLAEYFMLQTYLLTGGDYLINLLAFAAYAGSVIGVSAIAAALRLGSRAQAWAALFCATLPAAALQGSGAKNDLLLAFYLVCAIYFAARREALSLALATALALSTKGTAYLFLPPVLVYTAFVLPRRSLLWIPAAVLLINGPQYLRNWQLSGSPLGYDSAHGDGFFRWRNQSLGWQPLVSNALRHLSEQLGGRREAWNQTVYRTVVRAHYALGLDPQSRDTTWPGARYAPPLNTNHEANANNHWQLLLLIIAAVYAVATRDRPWILYAAGLLAAFLLFCWYLKWQPFLARLELPLFVAAAPLAAMLIDRLRHPAVALLLALFLVNNARPALFENWTRPLQGPRSLWVTTRNDNYFSDMGQWHNRQSYLETVDRLARSGCTRIGLDITANQLEYPVMALLRQRVPEVRFMHTGVTGPAAVYAGASEPSVCAILCPDCEGNQAKLAAYGDWGSPVEIGRFLLFLRGK